MQSMKNFLGKLQEKVDFSKRFGIIQIKIEVDAKAAHFVLPRPDVDVRGAVRARH